MATTVYEREIGFRDKCTFFVVSLSTYLRGQKHRKLFGCCNEDLRHTELIASKAERYFTDQWNWSFCNRKEIQINPKYIITGIALSKANNCLNCFFPTKLITIQNVDSHAIVRNGCRELRTVSGFTKR